jgi:transcriptional regulator with XRE-family HTH domain
MSEESAAIQIKRIVELRHALDLSQAKFAEKIKISKGYIGRIEQGSRRVNDRIIRIIALTFGVNERWLQTGDGPMFVPVEDANLNLAVSLFKKLDPAFQDCGIRQLDMLLELQDGRTAPALGQR